MESLNHGAHEHPLILSPASNQCNALRMHKPRHIPNLVGSIVFPSEQNYLFVVEPCQLNQYRLNASLDALTDWEATAALAEH